MNQQCEQYGKLLCNACIVEVPQMGDRSRQQLIEKSLAPLWLFVLGVSLMVSVVSFGFCLGFGLPWWGALVGGVIRENSFWLAYFPLRGERLFKKTDVHRRLKAFAFDASLARMLLEQAESQTAQ